MEYSKHQQGTPRPQFASTAERCAQGTEPSRVGALGCTWLALRLLLNKETEKEGPSTIHLDICSSNITISEGILTSTSLFTRELDKGTNMIAGDRIQVFFFLSSLILYYTDSQASLIPLPMGGAGLGGHIDDGHYCSL